MCCHISVMKHTNLQKTPTWSLLLPLLSTFLPYHTHWENNTPTFASTLPTHNLCDTTECVKRLLSNAPLQSSVGETQLSSRNFYYIRCLNLLSFISASGMRSTHLKLWLWTSAMVALQCVSSLLENTRHVYLRVP